MNHIHCIFRTITEKANYKYDLYVWGITKAIFFVLQLTKKFSWKKPQIFAYSKRMKRKIC